MSLMMGQILRAAADQQTYYNGIHAYAERLIREYSAREIENGEEVSAVVGGTRLYYVRVTLSRQGEVLSHACTCGASTSAKGACEHAVSAMILHSQGGEYIDFDKGMSRRKAENDPQRTNQSGTGLNRSIDGTEISGTARASMQTKPHVPAETSVQTAVQTKRPPATDGVARLMLNKYTFRENAEIVGQSFSDEEKVTLTPVLNRSVSEDFCQIELTVGVTRHYIVKDIFEMVDHVKAIDKVSYGKQLEFIHSMDSFEQESKALLRFVMDKCEEIRVYTRSLTGRFSGEIGLDRRRLMLSPGGIDRLMTMYAGRSIQASLGAEPECKATVVCENPVIDVHLINRDDDTVLLITDRFGLAYGEKHLCVQRGERIFLCDGEYSEKTRDFLRAMEKCSFKMRISKTDLPKFCSNVLPTVQDFFNFTGDASSLEEHMPLPLETEILMDAPERNVITASMIYRYGDKEVDFYALHFAGKTPDIGRRDLRGEMKVRVLISKYFQYYDTNHKVLRLEADDPDIFRFISEGIPAFMELATIRVTDRLQKIGALPPPKISVGVSLHGSLLELDIDAGEFPPGELLGVLNAYRENRKYYRLSDGRFLRMEDSALNGLAQIADGLELSQKQLISGKVKVPGYRALYLDRVLHENEEIRFTRDKYFKDLVRNVRSVEYSDLSVPDGLSEILRNYQKTGFRWMKTLERYHLSGILADDMGLGKTLQIIALFLSAKEEGVSMPSLVVCPASLALNWESEIRRFAPSLAVTTVIGDTLTRKDLIEEAMTSDVVITSYDMLKRDIELYAGKKFYYEIIDEAQYIKNHSTQNAKSVKAIESEHRFALTGTPVENRLSELWSIFDYLMPGYLYGYQKFKKRFEVPAVKNGDSTAIDQLRKMTAPFVLRRLKSEVLAELPQKAEAIFRTPMEGEQRKLYAANVALIKKRLTEEADGDFEQQKFNILSMITKLRQICCDPALCYEEYSGPSAKLDVCMELLHESTEGGHKVLLFSQFTSMLATIEEKLIEEGISYYVLKGDTPKEKRAQLVERFNNDRTQVFLISLKAGGTGLNLTGADVVIHYDPWWNVAAQNQATDRAHRIGQKNSVQVYKLVTTDSIEEKILRLQETKRELAESIISDQGSGSSLFTMTRDELLELLS